MRPPRWLTWLRDVVGRPLHAAIHYGLLIVMPIIGFPIVARLWSEELAKCDFGEVAYLPDWLLLIPALVGLAAGRYLSWLVPPQDYEARAHRELNSGAKRVGPTALVLASAALVVIWFYEAVGTAHYTVVSSVTGRTANFEPITYYIRCAIYHDKAATDFGFWTMVTILLFGFVVGHWFWSDHPGDAKENDSKVAV